MIGTLLKSNIYIRIIEITYLFLRKHRTIKLLLLQMTRFKNSNYLCDV